MILQHVPVGSLGDGPQMGWDLIPPLAQVHLDHSLGVDGVPLVGVDDNTEETRVGVDKLGLETDLQVVEDRGIIEESQVSHVFAFLELGRVDLANLLRLEDLFLKLELLCLHIKSERCKIQSMKLKFLLNSKLSVLLILLFFIISCPTLY